MTALFLSHSHIDRDLAVTIGERLKGLGLAAVFLDVDPDQGVAAGKQWEDELYRGLRSTDAVVALVSDAFVASRWCFAELALARSLGRPIFPLRAGGRARLDLLVQVQEIDLAEGDAAFARLTAGLRRAGLDPESSFVWDPARSPYPGLGAFAAEDAAVFFGRDAETARLLELLAPTLDRAGGRWIGVVGPSGGGKSSLVYAGLVPRLRRSNRWLVLPPFRPGAHPTRRLAACLAAASHIDSVERELAENGPDALLRHVQSRREAAGATDALIVLDQCEELVTKTGPREQAAVLRTLGAAIRADPGLWVVATLRSEFLGATPERSGLAAVIDDALIVEPLDRSRLTEVVEGPAQRAGLRFAPGLAQRMADETRGGDGLPLLAYTLRELADRAKGPITNADYDAVGGVVGALRRRADRLVDELERRGHGPSILPTLLRLADLDVESIAVRRRVPRSAFAPDETLVVDAFVDARLLRSDGDAAHATVEVAHEALLRRWEPLRLAIAAAEDVLRRRAELAREAADWQSGGRDASYLLRGNRLTRYEEWAGGNLPDVGPHEREFLAASRAAADTELHAVRRTNRRLRWLSSAVAVVAVVALVGAVLAVVQANAAREQAALATARRLLTQADQIEASQADAGLLLTVEAMHRIPYDNRDEARYALLSRLNRPYHIATPLLGHTGGVLCARFSPDGRTIATAGNDGTVRLWDTAGGRPLGPLPITEAGPVREIMFSPDGSTLAAVSGPTVRLWDSATRRPRTPPLVGPAKTVYKAVFSPDGRLLATGSDDGVVRLWDTATGQPHGLPLTGHTDIAYDLAFTPDGRILASASWDGTVRLWDVPGGRPRLVLRGHTNAVTAVAVTRDGSVLASASEDGTVRLWDLRTGRLRHTLDGRGGPIASLAVSPDGAVIASGDDRTVRLWDVATGNALGSPLLGHTSVVYVLVFAGPGKVVSGGVDGTVRLWDVPGRAAVGPPLTGHTSWVNDVAVSPDGTLLASASGDGTARLWQATAVQPVGQPLAGGPFYDIAVGPTGMVAAGGEGAVRLWDARSEAPAGVLTGHTGGIYAVAFAPNGVLASGGEDTTIRLWDPGRQRPTGPVLTAGTTVHGLVFSADGRLLASAGAEGAVRLWSMPDGKLLGALPGHDRDVDTVAFGPNGMLASGGEDKTIRLWDSRTLHPIGNPIIAGGSVRHVTFSPDGAMIAAGGSDATVSFWDTVTHAPRGSPLSGFTNWVNDIAFSPDGKSLATAADDRLQLWDVATSRPDGAPLLNGERVLGAAFSPDGSVLAAAGIGRAALWGVRDGELIDSACRVANRNLTAGEWRRYLGPELAYSPTCS